MLIFQLLQFCLASMSDGFSVLESREVFLNEKSHEFFVH